MLLTWGLTVKNNAGTIQMEILYNDASAIQMGDYNNLTAGWHNYKLMFERSSGCGQ